MFTTSILLLTFSFVGLVFSDQSNERSLSVHSSHCAGILPWSLWKASNSILITIHVNSTVCNFSSTPAYFTTISGAYNHFYLQSYNVIYAPSNYGFRVYARGGVSPTLSSSTLLGYASTFSWNLNWLGMLYKTSSQTSIELYKIEI